jgi:hypothetical protein
MFLSCEADELFYGGAAGGGKTDGAIIYSTLRRKRFPGSRGLIVRRTRTDLFMAGGVYDRSVELLAGTGAQWQAGKGRWVFPDGGFIEFGYAPDTWDKFKQRYMGMQVDDLLIEEA